MNRKPPNLNPFIFLGLVLAFILASIDVGLLIAGSINYEADLRKSRSYKSRLESDCKRLEETLAKNQKTVQEQKDLFLQSYNRYQETLNSILAEIHNHQATKQAAVEAFEREQARYVALTNRMAALEAEKDTFQKRLDDAKRQLPEVAAKQKEKETLDAQCATLLATIAELSTRRETLYSEQTNLTASIRAETVRYEAARAKRETTEKELESIREKLSAERSAQEFLENNVAELEARQTSLNSEIRRLTSTEARLKQAESDLALILRELNIAQTNRVAAIAEADRYRKDAEHQATLANRAAEDFQKISETLRRQTELESAAKIRQESASAKAVKAEADLAQVEAKLANLQKTLGETEAEVNLARRKSSAEIEQYEAAVAESEKKAVDFQAQIAELEKTEQNLTKRISALRQQLQEVEKRLDGKEEL